MGGVAAHSHSQPAPPAPPISLDEEALESIDRVYEELRGRENVEQVLLKRAYGAHPSPPRGGKGNRNTVDVEYDEVTLHERLVVKAKTKNRSDDSKSTAAGECDLEGKLDADPDAIVEPDLGADDAYDVEEQSASVSVSVSMQEAELEYLYSKWIIPLIEEKLEEDDKSKKAHGKKHYGSGGKYKGKQVKVNTDAVVVGPLDTVRDESSEAQL